MYDVVNYNLPPPLMDIYTRNSEIHHHDTRHNIDIHLPKVNFEISEDASYIKAYGSNWILPSNIQTHERHLK